MYPRNLTVRHTSAVQCTTNLPLEREKSAEQLTNAPTNPILEYVINQLFLKLNLNRELLHTIVIMETD